MQLDLQEIEQLNQQVKYLSLPSMRKIAYYECGVPAGLPIIYLHGTGSHFEGLLLHQAGLRQGFRIIAPDRPGVGLSDFQPNRKVLDWPNDILSLAEQLGLRRFGMMGCSGAGPYLMACAFALTDKVDYVVDLACAAPLYQDAQAIKQLGAWNRSLAKRRAG